jgi:hypothetical protein
MEIGILLQDLVTFRLSKSFVCKGTSESPDRQKEDCMLFSRFMLTLAAAGIWTVMARAQTPSVVPTKTVAPTPTVEQIVKEGVLTFKNEGKVVKTLDLHGIRSAFPVHNIVVHEHQTGQDQYYNGVSFNYLMDEAFGKSWRNAEEILFTCVDGYQPSIPVAEFLKYDATLAFGKAEGGAFSLQSKIHNKTVELGPWYVIWDNKARVAGGTDSPAWWPYQVIGIELVSFEKQFGALAPGRLASPEAKRGFHAWRKYCAACHSVNGIGSRLGPELNWPESVTAWFKPGWLVRWIDDPSSMRWGTTMPGLKQVLSKTDDRERKKIAEDIVAWLRDVAQRKSAPAPLPQAAPPEPAKTSP